MDPQRRELFGRPPIAVGSYEGEQAVPKRGTSTRALGASPESVLIKLGHDE